VDALEALAAGLPPDRLQALAGAFALDSLSLETEAGLSSREVHELADAARGLYHIAAGGALSDRCSRPDAHSRPGARRAQAHRIQTSPADLARPSPAASSMREYISVLVVVLAHFLGRCVGVKVNLDVALAL
jgi:hypothetical protein